MCILFFFSRIAGQRRRAGVVPHEPAGKRMRLSPAIANAGATYESVETHLYSLGLLILCMGHPASGKSEVPPNLMPGAESRFTARRWDTPGSCLLHLSAAAPWLWRN